MEFSQPKGIYQQIAEQMRDRILAGEWQEGQRIPSVRELAGGVGVNPNTVTKSYQALLDRQIIENQRGLGYFVANDAKRRILDEMRSEFVRDELPRVFRTMRVLGMRLEDLAPYFSQSNGEQARASTAST
jgi:DNA-binding transcriptional regulator YhcF (GntR family)